MSRDTTVKVSVDVRDRLRARAARQHLTANAYIARLIDAEEWSERMETAAAAMRSMSASERADYLSESAEWETTHTEIE